MKDAQKLKTESATIVDPADIVSEFLDCLLVKNLVTVELPGAVSDQGGSRSAVSLRRLWEASDISAHDFADEGAHRRQRMPRASPRRRSTRVRIALAKEATPQAFAGKFR